ncbi:hypothetical protein Droror1_Dr00004699 [Drosera rotundifolia]
MDFGNLVRRICEELRKNSREVEFEFLVFQILRVSERKEWVDNTVDFVSYVASQDWVELDDECFVLGKGDGLPFGPDGPLFSSGPHGGSSRHRSYLDHDNGRFSSMLSKSIIILDADLASPDSSPSSEDIGSMDIDKNCNDDANSLIYPYERLKVTSFDHVTDIDITKREMFSCRGAFYQVLVWVTPHCLAPTPSNLAIRSCW